jgi:hypothetical protein
MNIYGDGLYTTDSLNIAGKYQKKNKTRGAVANGVTYEVVEKRPTKFFDLDKPASEDVLNKLRSQASYPAMRELVETAIDEFEANPSLADVFNEIRNYSRGMEVPAHEIQEMWYEFTRELEKDGYGGFTHQGGRLAGKGKELHQVRIYWDPAESVEIRKVDAEGNRIGIAPTPEPAAPPSPAETKALFMELAAELREIDGGKLKGVSKKALALAEQGDHTQALAEATDYAKRRVAQLRTEIESIKQRAIEEGC